MNISWLKTPSHKALGCCFFALMFSGIANAGVPSTAKDVDKSPRLHGGKTIESQGYAIINGKKAVANSVLARLSNRQSLTTDTEKLLASQGVTVDKQFTAVEGLVRLTFELSETALTSDAFTQAASVDLASKIKQLEKSGKFEYVEPDWVVHLLNVPTDSAYTNGTLWGLNNQGQNGGTAGVDVNVISAWSQTTGDPNIVVGVVDTGIRYTHTDLASNMWVNPNEIPNNGVDDDNNGYIDDIYGINAINNSGDPFDDNDHGTHCAGTIAASGNDAGPIVGVAYTTKLMALKFLSASGSGSTSNAIETIQYALNEGVDILSNSWGGGGYSQSLYDVIAAANNAGVLFIAAAGNNASNTDNTTYYPQGYNVENVISVAAIDRTGNLASFSNYGVASVDIAAPGVAVYSSTASSDNSYSSFNGTSMATPHVAGVAALLLSEFPNASITDLKNRLLNSAVYLPALDGRIATEGMVNAAGALNYESDGILELQFSYDPLVSGEDAIISVGVSDMTPVTDATVTGGFIGYGNVNFLDNGTYPDAVAGDATYTGVLSTPSNVASVTFAVTVTAPGKQDAYEEIVMPISTPPSNDDFVDRIVLVNGSTTTTGSNVYATSETSEPINPGVAGGKTVWWEWTAPTGLSSATITTVGSNYDTTLAVYRGTSLNSLTLVGSNDDTNGLQSSVTFTPSAGQVYQVQVDGFGSREGNIQLNYPEPDTESDFPVIITQPNDQDVLAETELTLSVEAAGAPQLVYQWYQQVNGIYEPISGATDAIYRVANATLNDQGFYYVSIENGFGRVDSRAVFVSVNYFGLQPSNDDFTGSKRMFGGTSIDVGTNVLATRETMEPLPAQGAQPVESVWYSWTAPSVGEVSFSTEGSDFDTILAVYEGTDVSTLTQVAVNDDVVPGTFWSRVTFETTAGVEYRIAVDGFGANNGQVVLNHSYSGDIAPDNDSFERGSMFGSDGEKVGSNIDATAESNEPDHANTSEPLASVWWKWESPRQPGEVTMTTVGSDFDTTLAVYKGSDVNNLQLVAENDDFAGSQSRVTFDTDVNTTYSVAVDGYDEAEGNIVLDIRFRVDAGVGVPFDYDGDGIADLAVRRPTTGQQFIKWSGDGSIQRYYFGSQSTDVPIAGDFDGDGNSDVAVYRPSAGSWFILQSSDDSIFRLTFGTLSGDMPVPADYDGDGITDIAIRRPSSGQWIIRPSSSPSSFDRIVFGSGITDIPVPGDYDGDNIDDIAVRRPDSGKWFIKQSTNGSIARIFFGSEASDVPVPADYDGDGIMDLAVRRPSTGMWFIRYSSNGQIVRSYFGGEATDIPVPADYDGDGRADLAFRRPNSGQIILAQSGNNNTILRIGFGSQSSDMPIAAPLAYRISLASGASSASESDVIEFDHENMNIEKDGQLKFEVLDADESELFYSKDFINHMDD